MNILHVYIDIFKSLMKFSFILLQRKVVDNRVKVF
jgi:hypothetical protein